MKIIVKLSHLQQGRNVMNLLLEFTLNLDHLSNKKVQFFPFGKNDKVLKITTGEKDRIALPNCSIISNTNQQFIKQKEEFLKRLNTTSSSRFHQDSSSRKSFSEQAKDLISEIRSIRDRKPRGNLTLEEEFNDYYDQPLEKNMVAPKNKRTINKSSS